MDSRSAGQVIAAAELLGIAVSDDDLAWLADALAEQRAIEAVLDDLVLDEVDPLITFDPRWHD
ncbi:MAG: hypothetical protein ACRDPY_14090 [Streptosporangiaceae bacterium]